MKALRIRQGLFFAKNLFLAILLVLLNIPASSNETYLTSKQLNKNSKPSVFFTRDKDALELLAQQCNQHFLQQQKYLDESDAKATLLTKITLSDGRHCGLVGMFDGQPRYYVTDNAASADTISTDEVRSGGNRGLNLDGSGVLIGLWDSHNIRSTHVEIRGNAINVDGTGTSDHATHVAGTLIAEGQRSDAKGMAPGSSLRSFTFDNDITEMADEQLSESPPALSVHPYSILSGWAFDFRNDRRWVWFGDTSVSNSEDWMFGFYDESSRLWDQLAFDSPGYLIVKSAGNDRDDKGPIIGGEPYWIWERSQSRFVQSTTFRPADGGSTGYDTIAGGSSNAKNILTVGAINAVPGGYSSPFDGGTTVFSGWGPVDDGRIKPDLVAQGVNVFSSTASNDSSYGGLTGTSSSAPVVAGSIALLIEHRSNTGESPLLSSSLRGLVVHTADDLGNAIGPNYQTGWGLMNTASSVDLLTDDANAQFTTHISEFNLQNNTEYSIDVISDGHTSIKATLAWTDPAGNVVPKQLDPNALMLVNDLDLRIIDPDGDVHMPWQLDPGLPQNSAVRTDNFRDNIEQVLAGVLLAGEYTIKVSHKGVLANGSQTASLIVSGNVDASLDPTPPVFISEPSEQAYVDAAYQYNASNLIEVAGSFPIALSLTQAPEGMVLDNGRLIWTPAANQVGQHAVEITAQNSLGVVRQAFNLVVNEAVFDFSSIVSSAYGGQDGQGSISISDNGVTFTLRGNRARSLPFDYQVTANTRIAFEFTSDVEGEIHAIGLDDNNSVSQNRTFQLYGTQTWGVQDFNNYQSSDGSKHYDIPVGEYFTGTVDRLFFIMDHDVNNPTGESVFAEIRVYEYQELSAPIIDTNPVTVAYFDLPYSYTLNATGTNPITYQLIDGPAGITVNDSILNWQPSDSQGGIHAVTVRATNTQGFDEQVFQIEVSEQPLHINLNESAFGQYANQDVVGSVAVESNGAELRMVGNRARQMPFDYIVTENTRLNFEFSSSRQGELHAIGLDDNLQASADRTFQLYGTQRFGVQDFKTYPGDGSTVNYDIPIGQYVTGQMNYLFFIMDHDVNNPTGESVFGRIRVYEYVEEEQMSAPRITSTPITAVTVGDSYQYNLIADGSETIDFSLASAPAGMQLNNGVLSWLPTTSQIGTHSVSISASNAIGIDNQSFTVTVREPEPQPEPGDYLSLNTFQFGQYANQDVTGSVTIESNGTALHLVGNRVRQMLFNYTVTSNTRLSFDFSSDRQGELHAIGLDNDLQASADRTFQLYGTQRFGVQDFKTYPGDGSTVNYDIPIGQYVTGEMNYLFFIMDHDVSNPTGESVFSRIRVYEYIEEVQATAPEITSTPITTVTAGDAYQYGLVASGSGPINFNLTDGPEGMQLINGTLIWSPLTSQIGTHNISVRAGNNVGSVSQSFTVTVHEAENVLNLNDFLFGQYANQDVIGSATIESNGAVFRLTGNRVRQMTFNYAVTENTRLNFEFSSNRQGELHAIGLDNDLQADADRTFQLYGTQRFGIQDFKTYPGNGSTVVYDIPIGQYITGQMNHLFFIMDHDVSNPTGESVFGNIRIYEE